MAVMFTERQGYWQRTLNSNHSVATHTHCMYIFYHHEHSFTLIVILYIAPHYFSAHLLPGHYERLVCNIYIYINYIYMCLRYITTCRSAFICRAGTCLSSLRRLAVSAGGRKETVPAELQSVKSHLCKLFLPLDHCMVRGKQAQGAKIRTGMHQQQSERNSCSKNIQHTTTTPLTRSG